MRTLALVALLLTTACSQPSNSTVASTAAANTTAADRTTWYCEGQRTFEVSADGEKLNVYAGGQTYNLSETPSQNGVSYTDGHVAYWEHQDMAALDGAAGGPYGQCWRTPQ